MKLDPSIQKVDFLSTTPHKTIKADLGRALLFRGVIENDDFLIY